MWNPTYASKDMKFCPLLLLTLTVWLTACETPIEVTIPDAETMLVVEGRIDPGLPPLVLLSRSQDYFAPVDAASLGSLYQGGGTVTLQSCQIYLNTAALVRLARHHQTRHQALSHRPNGVLAFD